MTDLAKLPYRPCVGVMLVNAEGKVFVGQRLDSAKTAWQMPQGGIDDGEDVETAGLRELWEETGVTADLVRIEAVSQGWITYDLPAELIGTLWKGRYRGQKQKWLLMRFLGSDADVRIETDHPEFSAWEWIHPDQLVPRIVPFKRDVYRAVLQEFGPQL